MKQLMTLTKFAGAVAFIALLAACATTQQKENMLSAAGFKTMIASTPQQQQHLRTLPVGKVSVVKRNGKTYFVYPDVAHNQIYVGTQAQYSTYQQMKLARKQANEDLETAKWDAAANSQMWDVWGPFGGVEGGLWQGGPGY